MRPSRTELAYFDPQPTELPDRMPSPFGHDVHPLAARAAAELRVTSSEGKMFGVLVVEDRDGRVGYLKAFSGMLDGSWWVDGFVGPAFDEAARAWWPEAEAQLGVLAAQLAECERAIAPIERALAEVEARHAAELAVFVERRTGRRHRRERGEDATALDRESQRDGSERRRVKQRHAGERAAASAGLAELTARRDALERERAQRSREHLVRLHASYVFANARGEVRTVRELFAPAEPPGGAGDCAGPKLFAHAYRAGLRPIALAEIWIGPSEPEASERAGWPREGKRASARASDGEVRTHGQFYPACRGKCGPILAHVTAGLAVEPAPVFATRAHADEPRVVWEDAWLLVVEKPAGMLSVPGRGQAMADTAITRLRARHPGCEAIHRLDLDTSGLLLVAKDRATCIAMQARFAQRLVDKRYVAVLDGDVAGDAGVIDLPLRLDVGDRPRQVVDHVHGKRAITEWRVLAHGPRARVELCPRTGRSHQLRVHAARGLGAPIAGDRLYGTPGARLQLHAAALAFAHPHTGERVELVSVVPF